MRYRLTPRSMIGWPWTQVWIFREFRGISQISDGTTAKRMKIHQYCQRQRCKHVELEQFWHAFASRGFVSDSWAFLFNVWWQINMIVSSQTTGTGPNKVVLDFVKSGASTPYKRWNAPLKTVGSFLQEHGWDRPKFINCGIIYNLFCKSRKYV